MVRSAVGNGLWNALSHVTLAASGILGSVLIVRSLDATSYGVFSYYAWLAGLLCSLGVLAFPQALTKITSELRGQGYAEEAARLTRWSGFALVTLNTCISLALLFVALNAPIPERHYLLVIAALPAFNALGRILNSALWGCEHYRLTALTTTIAALGQLGLIALAARNGWGIPGYLAAIFSINLTVPVLLGTVQLLSRPPLSTAPSRRWPARATLAHYLAFSAPSTIILLVDQVVWQRSEIFFLERFASLAEIGYYNLAYTFSAMFLALGWALINAFYPSISRDYGAGESATIRIKITQAVHLAALYAVPLTLGGLVTLSELITLVYGARMQAAAPVAAIFFVGLLPGVLSGLFGLTVSALNRIWLMAKLGLAMALLNLLLDVLLIPTWHAQGAAIANTLSQAVHMFSLLWVVRSLTGVQLPWRALGGLSVIGGLTTWLLPSTLATWLPGPAGLATRIVLAGGCYTAAVWSLGYLRPLGLTGPFTSVTATSIPHPVHKGDS